MTLFIIGTGLFRPTRKTGRAARSRAKKTEKRHGVKKWPIYSDALAVHPKQIPEAVELAKKRGVPTSFLPDGRPVMTGASHFKEYCKAHGFVHKGY